MPKFSLESLQHLSECDPRIQRVLNIAIAHYDIKVLDGRRTIAEQRKNVAKGVSKTMASKHLPDSRGFSRAVDVMPFTAGVPGGVDWANVERGMDAAKRADPQMKFAQAVFISGVLEGIAIALGIETQPGIDWDDDGQIGEHSFLDLPHHELK